MRSYENKIKNIEKRIPERSNKREIEEVKKELQKEYPDCYFNIWKKAFVFNCVVLPNKLLPEEWQKRYGMPEKR